jgi:hypothetical protein
MYCPGRGRCMRKCASAERPAAMSKLRRDVVGELISDMVTSWAVLRVWKVQPGGKVYLALTNVILSETTFCGRKLTWAAR